MVVVLDTKFLIIYGFLLPVLVSCAKLPPTVLSYGGPGETVPEASRTARRGGGAKSKQNIQHVQVVVLPNSQVHQPNTEGGDPQAAGYVWVPYLSERKPSEPDTPLPFRPSIQQPSLSRNPFLQGTVQPPVQLPVQSPQPAEQPSQVLQEAVQQAQPQQQKPFGSNPSLQGTVQPPQPVQAAVQEPRWQPQEQKPLASNPFLQGTVQLPVQSPQPAEQPSQVLQEAVQQAQLQQQKPFGSNPFLQGTVQPPQPVQAAVQEPQCQPQQQKPFASNPFLQETVQVSPQVPQSVPSNNPFLQGTPLFQASFQGDVKGNGQYGWGHAHAGNVKPGGEEQPQLAAGPQLSVAAGVPAGPPAIQPVPVESPQVAVAAANPQAHWGHADSSGPRQVPNVGPQVLQVPKTGGALNGRCLKATGQFPSDACNAYVNCWNGEAIEQTCPDGLVFSAKGYCDYPENVDCYGRSVPAGIPPTTASSNNNGATAAISIPNQPAAPAVTNPPILTNAPLVDAELRKKCRKARGQFPSDSCSRYVNCWDDVITEEQCPEGLLFSEKGYCDYSHRVNCQATTPSKSTSSPTTTHDAVNLVIEKECPADYGTFRDKTDCASYFTCLSGKIVAKYKCPEGLSYSDNLGVCDYNERVDCSKPPMIFTPKSLFISKIANSLPNNLENCRPGTILRLNPQCTSALLCRNGLSEVVQCPAGLAYDSKTDKCVLPNLAQC